MDLNELADRIERFVSSSVHDIARDQQRQLNEAVAQAIGIPLTVKVGDPALGNERWVPSQLKPYMTSIDAAMALVGADLPELTLNLSADAAQALIFRDGDGVVGRGDATGGNPLDRAARAITAAALRARSQATSQ